jgi:hypothetical protein
MTEDALEQYVLRHLSELEVDEVEKHIVSCGWCKRQLASTKKFIDTLREIEGMFEPKSLTSASKLHHCKRRPLIEQGRIEANAQRNGAELSKAV